MALKYNLTFAALILTSSTSVLAQFQEAKPIDSSNESAIVLAVVPPDTNDRPPLRSIELITETSDLSEHYGDWHNTTLLGTYETGAQVIQVELSDKDEFGQWGQFIGVADTVTINRDWFYRLSAGAGDDVFYLPRIRSDASLDRKWLENRNLVTSVGFGFYDAPDGHIDRSLSVGGTYYFVQPWIVEGGMRFNRSSPGKIDTHSQFVAVTYGHVMENIVTARYGWGGEGYQSIAEHETLVDFQSKEESLAWRHWLRNSFALIASL